MENMINKLESVIKEEYNNKYAEWLNLSHEELIEKSDEISAARFVKDNIQDSFTEEEAEYLLQFKEPLEILVDRITVLNAPNNIAVKEQFSDMVSEMYDKQDEYSDYELNEDSGMQMQ
ncbi:hypothetical protein [Ruminococcus flavefaciens]|uniref:hypothetical protein n=1 Tax=Ruminococcus flavefaciens TaxID=1265 RepID=UPI0026F2A343|nr:hypothetical protein [Ruminococcus flavefaciens]